VWLTAWNWNTHRPLWKFDKKQHGPFRVLAKVSPYAYRIELLTTMKCHNIHHISLLEPAANDLYPGQWPNLPPPVEIDGEDEYLIEAILDSQIHRCKLHYLVTWIRYDMADWEPAELHSECEAVDGFHEKYPNKLGPVPNAT
jgi:hypothetical protein